MTTREKLRGAVEILVMKAIVTVMVVLLIVNKIISSRNVIIVLHIKNKIMLLCVEAS